MRTILIVDAATAALLTAAIATGNGADAPTKSHAKKATRKTDPALQHMRDMAGFMDAGGPSGCYDPKQVTGYNRTVMERMGGTPCPSSAPKPPSPMARGSVSGWTGKYRDVFDGGKGFVDIAPQGAAYKVDVTVAGRGACSGSVSGTATPRGDQLDLTVDTGFDPPVCTVSMKRTGNRLDVTGTAASPCTACPATSSAAWRRRVDAHALVSPAQGKADVAATWI